MKRGMKHLVGALALSAAVAAPLSVEASSKTPEEQLAEQLAAANEELYRQVLAANEELYRQLMEAAGQPVQLPKAEAGKEKESTEKESDETASAEGEDSLAPDGKMKLLTPEETLQAVLRMNGVLEETAAESAAEPAAPAQEAGSWVQSSGWSGPVLNKDAGTVAGPSGQEYYYNLDMQVVVDRLHNAGYEGSYWVREDGVKMFGDYIMVAAAYWVHPLGSILETTLGTAIVGDTGGFAAKSPYAIDIATNW